MSTDIGLLDEPSGLAPVKHPVRWIASGFSLQVAGIGIPAAVVLERAKKDNVLGQITRYTVRLAWHEALRSTTDLALILLGLALFATGSILIARPFAKRRSTLLVAVPIAATAGVLVFGIAALICAALIALAALLSDGDLGAFDLDWLIPQGTFRRRDEDR